MERRSPSDRARRGSADGRPRRLSAVGLAFWAGALGTACGHVDSPHIPNEVIRTDASSELRGLANERYCEVLLGEGSWTDLRLAVFNTIHHSDCPPDAWEALDANAIQAEYEALHVERNGPRFWVVDGVRGSAGTQRAQFGELEMTLVAMIQINTLSGLPGPYTTTTVQRTNVWLFDAATRVFELVDADGRVFRMQSYTHAVDDTLDIEALASLGDRLSLPPGWRFRTRVLEEDAEVIATDGTATMLTDELRSAYQLLEEAP